MANITDITQEFCKLKHQIDRLLSLSKYEMYDDLSGVNFDRNSPDELQLVNEYRGIFSKLYDIQYDLEYLSRPIKEVGFLHLNNSGRYETKKGYYYTSGNTIEYLCNDGVFLGKPYWKVSRVEHDGASYYIVGESNLELSKVKVRVRG